MVMKGEVLEAVRDDGANLMRIVSQALHGLDTKMFRVPSHG